MSYSPKFQEILDKVQAMQEANQELSEIREFFYHSVKNLSQFERMNNLYRIRPKRVIKGSKNRMAFFKMNRMQEHFHKNQTNRDLILKMRQGGVTTYSCIKALDHCLWEDGFNAAIMAHVRDNVKKFFKITKSAFDQFNNDWGDLYPVSTKYNNTTELEIKETGSVLYVVTETKGLTLDFLHISEACFVEDDRISESLESVPSDGHVIMESTPNTASGLFYELWELDQRGEGYAFKGHFYPWWYQYPEESEYERLKPKDDFKLTDKEAFLMDQHDLTVEHIIWRRIKIAESGGDAAEFQRKYPEDAMTCFMSGASNYFPMQVMLSLHRSKKDPGYCGNLLISSRTKVKFVAEDNIGKLKDFPGLKIWEMPDAVTRYAIGVDTAEGVGGDASCAQVVNCTTGHTVACFWSDSIDPDNFAAEVYKLGMFYNKAWLCIEQNNHGNTVISQLAGHIGGLGYPHLYKRYETDRFTEKRTEKIGFKTGGGLSGSKANLLNSLKAALRDGKLRTFDPETVLELGNFVRDSKTGRLSASGTGHDDRVMALALAWEQARILIEQNNAMQYDHIIETPNYDPMTGFII